MRRLLLAIALLLPAVAHAQFAGYSCVPGLYGTTLDVAAPKRYDAGWRLVWLCKGDGDKVHISALACVHGTCIERTLRNVYMAASTAADPKAAIDAAVKQHMTSGSCETATGNLKTVCDLAMADGRALAEAYKARVSVPPPPAATWTVASTAFGSRPTYVWDGTTRGSTASERVNVGESCDPAVGSGSYRGVLGRTDRVAFCVEVKP